MSAKLSDAIRRYGYEVVVDPAETPGLRSDVDGRPPSAGDRGVVACRRGDGSVFIAIAADNWQFAEEAAHEIAELKLGREHNARLYSEQCSIMQDWITTFFAGPPALILGMIGTYPESLPEDEHKTGWSDAHYPDAWLEWSFKRITQEELFDPEALNLHTKPARNPHTTRRRVNAETSDWSSDDG